jgi:plastocyanin domain-containing protein
MPGAGDASAVTNLEDVMQLTSRLAAAVIFATLGLGAANLAHGGDAPASSPAAAPIEIVVEAGYHPDRIVVKEGEPVKLRFVRKEYTGCTLEVVFPTLGIRRKLPTNEPVDIDLGTPAAGEIPFHCGMKMIHGLVVVEPKE